MKKILAIILLLGSVAFAKAQTIPQPTKTASSKTTKDTTKKVSSTSIKDTTKKGSSTSIDDTTKKGSPASSPDTLGSMKPYLGNTYIFDRNFPVYGCDAVGHSINGIAVYIYKHSLFQVVDVYIVKKVTYLVIKFNEWHKSDYNNRLTFNLNPTKAGNLADSAVSKLSDNTKKLLAMQKVTDENAKYFVISETDFTSVCSQYTSPRSASLTFGTFTTPFKFRPTKSLFTSDLSLGTVAYYNLKVNEDVSYGVAFGVSLTSVTLDSLSTNGKVKSSSDRPALTPSASFVITVKGISFTIGAGIDYINKTTAVERSWVFNNKPWIGFGIGLNLFGATPSNNTTTPNSKQSK
ncbi:hypothetical protein [uncultured Mucilaginibacter sp.]|uniref:hypothetical protein n=1 Tax=uncultured Mucilaginibacter sp. TaxID=797541 RepID=UPI0025CBC228|nr:hypothetical protein [uncultured Mucilaginibacter sp.]